MGRILDELLDITKLQKIDHEDEQRYLLRLVVTADEVLSDDRELWNSLAAITKRWLNTAIEAIEKNKPIPIPPGMTSADLNSLTAYENSLIKQVMTRDTEGMVEGVEASRCERGKPYKIDSEGTLVLVECMKVLENKVVFEDMLSNRYYVTPISTVIPVDEKDKVDVAELMPPKVEPSPSNVLPTRPPMKEEKPQVYHEMTPTRAAQIMVLKNPDIKINDLMRLLEASGFVAKKSTVQAELVYIRKLVSMMKNLGMYQPYDVKKDLFIEG